MAEVTSMRPQLRDSKNPIEEPEIVKYQDLVSDDNQDGVRIAEAVALSWSKTSLVAVYCWYVFAQLWNKTLLRAPEILMLTMQNLKACGCCTFAEP